MSSDDRKNRKTYLDFLRIVAIFMVLFNHTKELGYTLFVHSRGSVLYPFYLCNSAFIKIAVPLFFMISGALLLEKEENYRSILKRFFRFLIVLLVASFISYCYNCFRNKEYSFSILAFFEHVYSDPVSTGLWYMYAYLAYILMLPFLRLIAKGLDKSGFKWLLIMYGFISVLPILEYLIWRGRLTHYASFDFFISGRYVIYPLIGYYLERKIEIQTFKRSWLHILIAFSLVAIIFSAGMTHLYCSSTGNWGGSSCEKFFNNLIFIPAGTVFLAVKYCFYHHAPRPKIQNAISVIGGATFGLYLIENICRRESSYVLRFLKGFPPLLSCWIWIFLACVMGILITLVIKKIPGINKYI